MCTTFRPAAVIPVVRCGMGGTAGRRQEGELQWGCNGFGGGKAGHNTERETGEDEAGRKRSRSRERKVKLKSNYGKIGE